MNPKESIAIVGLGCRFPGGVNNPNTLWKLLVDRVDAISEVPADRWHLPSFYHPDAAKPGRTYSRWGGFLQNVDEFDAQFFGISPREAAKADPQQRLLLEVAYEALEDAGIPPDRIAGTRGGVFIGISTYDYGAMQASLRERSGIDAYTNLGSALSIAANRISYLFDLHGPSMAVDTACSSSLVATHLACQSIWNGDSELAFIGGVNLTLRPEGTIGFSKASMLAPDGRCKTFDAAANGYVRAEGIGVLIVEPLSRAVSNRDAIYAVIRSTAVNQDGRTVGISVPSGQAQEAMLREALRQADIPSESIQYVEAHGTGTPVGDPIEATALGKVFGERREPGNYCLIGSIKSNIGHPEAASGAAGLIKAALCLKHAQIPPSLHFVTPNPEIPFEDLHLRVVSALENWPPTGGGPRRVGVNSFGFGGTNAHVILEAAPEEAVSHDSHQAQPSLPAHLLVLSARSDVALRDNVRSYADFLANHSHETRLRDVTYTASLRRAHHDFRFATAAHSKDELVEHLRAFLAEENRMTMSAGRRTSRHPLKPVFVFSGMGQQWWAMGRELMAEERVYRETIERINALFQGYSGWSLLKELLADEGRTRIDETHVAQPAIFSMQVALAKLWSTWGIEPAGVVGHSVGEVAAAHIAGALTLEDSVQIIFHRSRLQELTAGKGAMLAVDLSTDEAAEMLAGKEALVSVAAVNSRCSTTFTGDKNALKQIAEFLNEKGTFCRFLQVDVPYHSPAMDPLHDEFITCLRGLHPEPAKTPLFSTVTGGVVAGTELGADYWWQNIRNPVRFHLAMKEMIRCGHEVFLEVGAHPILSAAIQECQAEVRKEKIVLPSLHRKEREKAMMLGSLGRLYTLGAEIDWRKLYPEDGVLVKLPLYPWQRDKHWNECDSSLRDRLGKRVHPFIASRLESSQAAWETELDPILLPYLKDHRVQGSMVCPAAVYVEMALAAAREILGPTPCVLEELELTKALFFGENDAPKLQITVDSTHIGFEISSHSSGASSWASHANGKLRQSTQVASNQAIAVTKIRERCRTLIAKDDCYRSFERIGLNYGPMFRGIDQLWSGAGEALGEIQIPECLAGQLDDYRSHPALLDSCFQVLLGTIRDLPDTHGSLDRTYLPVRIERLLYHSAPGQHVLCYAKLTEFGPKRLSGDIQLLDEAGNCLMEVCGFTCRSIERSSEHTRGCLYEYQWKLQPRPWKADSLRISDFVPSPFELAPCLHQETVRLRKDLRRDRYYGSFLPPARNAAAAYVIRALRNLGWDPVRDSMVPVSELADRIGVVPEHRRLLSRLLHGLSQEEIAADLDPRTLWKDLWQKFPDAQAELTLLRDCAEALPAVFRGEVDPLTLIFPEGSATTLEHLYQDSPSFRIYNRLVQKTLREVIRQLPKERMLRLLEIGGGTGGMTTYLLPVLPPERVQYIFTDVAPLLVSQAEQKFRESSFVQYRTLDIEKDAVEQGFTPHSFDVILASDVLHATRDLRSTVDRVRSLLGSNGLLVMLEGARAPLGIILIFGLLKGWWLFADEDLRGADPWVSPLRWQAILEEAGFSETVFTSDCDDVENAVHSVILSRAPKLAEGAVSTRPASEGSGNWMIFCDRGTSDCPSVGLQLAERLRERGDHAILVWPADEYGQLDAGIYQLRPGSSDDVRRLINSVGQNLHRWRGVLHLWSLDAAADRRAPLEALDQMWPLNCVSVLHLIQALGACEGDVLPGLWLLTRNAQFVTGVTGDVDVTQSALWGLGRVAVNEYPQLRCRMVDFLTASPDEILSLVAELYTQDEEDEVAIRGETRFVHRLTQTSLTTLSRIAPPMIPGSFRIVPQKLGVLDSLAASTIDRRSPNVSEVEIEIQTTGLNFKDVMLSMGLLPDEGVTDGSAEVSLGLECAGRIVAVGDGVTRFSIGDEVIACGSGTLASHVTLGAGYVMHKPAQLDFEEATTIPVAFLTAYYALHHLGRMQKGERVLIHAATGGVGLAAVQLAQRAGVEIFATAGTPAKRELLRALGVETVMDSRSLAFAEETLAATGGEGVDLVLNSLAGEAISKSLGVLRPGGRFLEIGKRDIYENKMIGLRPFLKNLSFFGIDLNQAWAQNAAVVRSLFSDVIEIFKNETIRPICYRAIPAGRVVSAFRHMAKAKHIGKVVLCMDETEGISVASRKEAIHCRPDGTYLITGGLGGFGLAAAEWLVKKGARHLVLMGRRTPSPDATAAVASLESMGACVVVRSADVTKTEQVRDVLDFVHDSMPPLRGILHAAMVLDDAPILSLTEERVWRAFAPKAVGAWNLHRLTADIPLDFFLMFSSFTSLIGNPGQANYVAGNAFLDALAYHRRVRGLPALAVNWGALAQFGYVAQNPEVKEKIEKFGVKSMPASQLLDVLGELMSEDAVQVGVAKIEWDRVVRLFGPHVSPRFTSLVGTLGREEGGSTIEVAVGAILEANPTQRQPLLEAFIREHLAKVMGTSPSRLDINQPLMSLGLDSLMAVEMRTRIQMSLAVDVPPTKFLEGISISDLATFVAEKLALTHPGTADKTESHVVSENVRVLEKIDELSNEEVDRRLRAIVA